MGMSTLRRSEIMIQCYDTFSFVGFKGWGVTCNNGMYVGNKNQLDYFVHNEPNFVGHFCVRWYDSEGVEGWDLIPFPVLLFLLSLIVLMQLLYEGYDDIRYYDRITLNIHFPFMLEAFRNCVDKLVNWSQIVPCLNTTSISKNPTK